MFAIAPSGQKQLLLSPNVVSYIFKYIYFLKTNMVIPVQETELS